MSTWQDVVDRASSDAQFRDRLKLDPATACTDVGVNVPAGTTIRIIERQPEDVYLILNPLSGCELDDAALEGVAGGTGFMAVVAAQQAKAQLMDEEVSDSRPTLQTPTPAPPPKQPTTPKRPRGIT